MSTDEHGTVPPADPDATQAPIPGEHPGDTIGLYQLLQKVGEGGMGEVWVAEQRQPVRRTVALKVIKRGMDTRQVIARFEAERQALAMMDHPAIAKVLDAGATMQGRPFFVMEYVKGEPLTTYCDRHRLSTPERLEIFMRVCEGVQHAHQKGIIHRDLKPSNVLVTVQDGHAVPKIIDFGVAKATAHRLTEQTVFTELGLLVGTPEYMSPEQAEMTGLDVDTRTDIYSLGVMLYELLAGALPFDPKTLRQAGLDAIRRQIREVDPPRPSTRVSSLGDASTQAARNRRTEPRRLAGQLQGDLDWITMKALDKDRTRRYGSASELEADISRHLTDQPVIAGPPSTWYRARKFVRRHRFGVAVASVAIVTLIGFAVTMTVQAGRIARERDRANREAETSQRVSDFLVGLFKVADPSEIRGNSITAREVLDAGAAKIDRELKGQPLVQAQLMSTMGRVYGSLGLYNKGLPLQRDALDIRRNLLGEQNLDVASSKIGVADLIFRQGEYEEARALYEQALAVRERLLGSEAPAVADVVHNLGTLLYTQGKYDEAQRQLERALAIREKLAPDSTDVANTLNSLGAIAYRKGNLAEAGRLWERTVAIREKALGPENPLLAQTLNNLALVHAWSNDPAGARPLLERAMSIQEKTLGPKHPDLAQGLMNLGEFEARAGNLKAAQSYCTRAVAILEEASPGNPELARALDTLAWVTLTQVDIDGARRLYARSLALREKALGAKHHEVAASVTGLAECARRQGRNAEATTLYERALALCRRPDGGYYPQAAPTLSGYIAFLNATGQKARADEMQALAASIRKAGPS